MKKTERTYTQGTGPPNTLIACTCMHLLAFAPTKTKNQLKYTSKSVESTYTLVNAHTIERTIFLYELICKTTKFSVNIKIKK